MKIKVEENCDIWTVRRIKDDRFFILTRELSRKCFRSWFRKNSPVEKMTNCPKSFESCFDRVNKIPL